MKKLFLFVALAFLYSSSTNAVWVVAHSQITGINSGDSRYTGAEDQFFVHYINGTNSTAGCPATGDVQFSVKILGKDLFDRIWDQAQTALISQMDVGIGNDHNTDCGIGDSLHLRY